VFGNEGATFFTRLRQGLAGIAAEVVPFCSAAFFATRCRLIARPLTTAFGGDGVEEALFRIDFFGDSPPVLTYPAAVFAIFFARLH
jgi:hypothetical protein